jgi:hypothetical protein
MKNKPQIIPWHLLLHVSAVLIETDDLRAMDAFSVTLRLCEPALPTIDQETARILTTAFRKMGQQGWIIDAPRVQALMHDIVEQYRPYAGETDAAICRVQTRILSFTRDEARALYVFISCYNALLEADARHQTAPDLRLLLRISD